METVHFIAKFGYTLQLRKSSFLLDCIKDLSYVVCSIPFFVPFGQCPSLRLRNMIHIAMPDRDIVKPVKDALSLNCGTDIYSHICECTPVTRNICQCVDLIMLLDKETCHEVSLRHTGTFIQKLIGVIRSFNPGAIRNDATS